MSIYLPSILPIAALDQCKVHLASWNHKDQPLDVFVRDKKEWHLWNEYRNTTDEFNRKYIVSLIDFYPEPGTWLFGGLYKVLERGGGDREHSYKVELDPQASELIGRLKIQFKRPGRARALRLERYFDEMVVSEILREPYSGEIFCGYENIAHDFNELENIFKISKPDWKAALENVKGVYATLDKSNGKKYVGAAYGDSGIWSRWDCYIGTGHGWSDELTKVIEAEGMEYARQNFRISLLEHRPMKTEDKVLIGREGYWKEALGTRGEHGYNKN